MTFGWIEDVSICANKLNASCHCMAFSHALMAALQLIALGSTVAASMSPNNVMARCHCIAFSHALMAALKVTTFGVMFALCMSSKKLNACCQRMAFSHALITALKLMIFGLRSNLSHASKEHHGFLPTAKLFTRTHGGTTSDNIWSDAVNAVCARKDIG